MYSFGKKFDTLDEKMFKGRGFKLHAQKVFHSLDSTCRFLRSSPTNLTLLEENLKQLGAKHIGHGILPEQYPEIGKALMKTLSMVLGDNFTPQLEDAWGAMYGFITKSMLDGSNESLLRVTFPVYGDKGKTASLDEYLCSMLPGQKDLFYITAKESAGAFNFNKLDKMQLAKDLQHEGVVILHIAKNKRDLYANNLAKYLGCKMVDVEGDDLNLSFLPQIEEKYNLGIKAGKARRRSTRRSMMLKHSKELAKLRQSVMNDISEQSEGSPTPGDRTGQTIEIRTGPSSPVPVVTHKTVDRAATKRNSGTSTGSSTKSTTKKKTTTARTTDTKAGGLSEHQATKFCHWFQHCLGEDQVVDCTPTCKFASQPARINDASASATGARHFEEYNTIRLSTQANTTSQTDAGGHHIEINPSHPLIVEIYHVAKRQKQKVAAKLLAENIYENCLINAGIHRDARSQVSRMNGLVLSLLQHVVDDD